MLILINAFNTHGQIEREEHIIDKHLRECLDSAENQTTIGMTGCAIRAGKEWDKELNKIYNLLISKLSVDEKEKLRISQKNWMAYRDREIESQERYT